jgi:hypothetical protein
MVEYILWVPDSIARPPGSTAGLLASNSGTSPHIEPNHNYHTQAGLFTPHQTLHTPLFPFLGSRGGEWVELGRSGLAAQPRLWRLRIVVCFSCLLVKLLASTSCPLINNHLEFEVLGLGASACAGHPLNLFVVGCEGIHRLVTKDGRLLRLKHLYVS